MRSFIISVTYCLLQIASFSQDIQLDTTEFNLGVIEFGKSKEIQFTVKNTGSKTLQNPHYWSRGTNPLEGCQIDTFRLMSRPLITGYPSGFFQGWYSLEPGKSLLMKLTVYNYIGEYSLDFDYDPGFKTNPKTTIRIKCKMVEGDKKNKHVIPFGDLKARKEFYLTKGKLDSIRYYSRYDTLYKIEKFNAGKYISTTVFSNPGPRIQFEKTVYDFGMITSEHHGNGEYKFTNTGSEPLIITNCQSSCGCLVPSYPKEPILPGKSNMITFRYDTKRIGVFEKTITVNTNAINQPTIVLQVKGNVQKALTSVQIKPEVIDVGAISFSQNKKAVFFYTNTGTAGLSWGCYGNTIKDAGLECAIKDKTAGTLYQDGSTDYSGNDGIIEVCLTNIYGDTGPFEKKITLNTNTSAPTVLIVKGVFETKAPADSTVYDIPEGKQVHYYKNGKLASILYYSTYTGKYDKQKFFQGCELKSILYYGYANNQPYREEIFEDGKFKEHRTIGK